MSSITNGATLPWNGLSKPYQWTASLAITTQPQSNNPPTSRQKFIYNGQDVNVGMWVANISNGLAWQIVSISAKTTSTVNVTLQDINRYNTYRDPAKTGNGKPATGTYVIFNLSDDGTPMVDPAPAGLGVNFFSTLTSRFAYIQKQYDLILNNPGFTAISGFAFGDVIAIDEPTQTFVLADSSHLSTIIGTVTAVDDSGVTFTVNPIRKVNDNLNYLPGQVGDIIYTDNSTPGGLTTSTGGTPVYLQLRQFTASTTTSKTFTDTVTPITTPGFTFNVNNVLTSIGGSGIPLDVVNAINATTGTSGVSATLQTSPTIQIIITAVDARAINFEDVSGSVTTDAGLTSAENGVKAIGLIIAGSSSSAIPPGLLNSYGFVFVQSSASTTWTITHNAATTNVSAQIYDNFSGGAASGDIILPDAITIVDINNITISFNSAQAGTALLTIFK